MYIAQGDKLREVRRSRMDLDQENTTLKTTLSRTKVSLATYCSTTTNVMPYSATIHYNWEYLLSVYSSISLLFIVRGDTVEEKV